MHLFDDGYEKLRERIFANQKKLGVIPADTKLEPWPKEVLKPWNDLSPEEKKLFIRQVEIFAAYEAYTDYEIGRVIQEGLGLFFRQRLSKIAFADISAARNNAAAAGRGTKARLARIKHQNLNPVSRQFPGG